MTGWKTIAFAIILFFVSALGGGTEFGEFIQEHWQGGGMFVASMVGFLRYLTTTGIFKPKQP